MNSIKTKKEVLADNTDYKTLINAVVNRIGIEAIEYVNSHGISAGFGGFVYYKKQD